jgi:hypothetical protein
VLVVCPFARTFAIVIFLSTCFLPWKYCVVQWLTYDLL